MPPNLREIIFQLFHIIINSSKESKKHFCISFFQSLLITPTPFDRLVPKALIRSQQKALLPMTWYHGLDHDKEVKGWFCTLKNQIWLSASSL